jgi:hypothetical protein
VLGRDETRAPFGLAAHNSIRGSFVFLLGVTSITACGGADPKRHDTSDGAGAAMSSGGSMVSSGGSMVSAGGSGGATTGGSGTETSGGTASAGTTGNGGSADGGSGGSAPHVVTACDSLAEAGVWENITPPGVDLSQFGISHITLSPQNPSTVYVGTNGSGLFKTTDCGASWVHADTGTLGAEIDTGTLGVRIDRENPDVLYTYSLYGENGFFKSTYGGVDWAQILPDSITDYAPYGGFVGGIDIDPNDSSHLLIGWHADCAAPYHSSCYAETTDSGETWTMKNGLEEWVGGEGASLQVLDSTTWLFSSSSNGLWRSTDSGGTWNNVGGASISHGAGQLYITPEQHYFLGTAGGVMYSDDGAAWDLIPNTGQHVHSVIGDGTNVWSSTAYPYNPGTHPEPHQPYKKATVADPNTWTTMDSPMLTSGSAELAYDADHHVLYGTNYWEGVWRVVVE